MANNTVEMHSRMKENANARMQDAFEKLLLASNGNSMSRREMLSSLTMPSTNCVLMMFHRRVVQRFSLCLPAYNLSLKNNYSRRLLENDFFRD